MPNFEYMHPDESVIDAGFWLRAATGAVRAFCGWHVCPVRDETLVVNGCGGATLRLPSLRVREVSGLRVAGEPVDLDAFDWGAEGTLTLRRGVFPDRQRVVEVDLVHGFMPDEVPDVLALVANLAKRAASGPGVVASQSVNGASVSYFQAGGAPLSVQLLGIEKQALSRYRISEGLA